MSHLRTAADILIADLGAFRKACEHCGVQFVEGGTDARWYQGKKMSCSHKVSHPNATFDVGLTEISEGRFAVSFDNYDSMGGMMEYVGRSCEILLQRYATEVAIDEYESMGFQVLETYDRENDEVDLLITKW